MYLEILVFEMRSVSMCVCVLGGRMSTMEVIFNDVTELSKELN